MRQWGSDSNAMRSLPDVPTTSIGSATVNDPTDPEPTATAAVFFTWFAFTRTAYEPSIVPVHRPPGGVIVYVAVTDLPSLEAAMLTKSAGTSNPRGPTTWTSPPSIEPVSMPCVSV